MQISYVTVFIIIAEAESVMIKSDLLIGSWLFLVYFLGTEKLERKNISLFYERCQDTCEFGTYNVYRLGSLRMFIYVLRLNGPKTEYGSLSEVLVID